MKKSNEKFSNLISEQSFDQKEDSVSESDGGGPTSAKYQLKFDSDLRLGCCLESVFIFSLTWSVGNVLKNEKRSAFI